MTPPDDRSRETDPSREEEELLQPAQEIVDPREGDPEPDAPDVEISGARQPVPDPAAGDPGTSDH